MEATNQPGRWESPVIPLPATGNIVVSVNHGRGVPPRHVTWVYVCLRADTAVSALPGDEIEACGGYQGSAQPTVWRNAAAVRFCSDSLQALTFHNKETGAYNNTFTSRANWALKCICTW